MLGRMEESTAGLVARYAERFPALNFASPEPGILDLVMSKPGKLNAADRRMHRQLADVWPPSTPTTRSTSWSSAARAAPSRPAATST